ncbi:MAG: GGDEF domain-containing protein, partial [bacterium]|nr:GGDEF domain-containing protein [bacterium]
MAKSFDLPYKGKSDEVKRQLLEFLNLKDKEALSSLPTPQDVEQADIKQLVTYCKELGISHRGKLSMVKARLLKTISEEAMTHVQAKQPEAQPAAAKAAEKQDEDQVTIHKDDLKMFQDLIAKQAKMEIDQVKLYNVAVKDEMTGLYNHRYLKQRLEQEIKNSDLFDAPVSFILSDVDHFKNFNDTYGHQEGDRVLKTVARLMQEAAENDICCRYGGEEFCVICPGKTSKQTMDVAEKIRAGVAGEPFEIEGKRVQITISLGVSSFPVDSSERDDLIKKADQAMYYAKEHGRDQAADYSALQHDDLDAASKAQEEHDLKVLDEQISEVNALQGDVEEKTLEDYTRDLASDDLSLKKKAILGLAKYDSPQVRELLELLVSDVNEEIRFFSTHVINALKGEIPLGQRPPELAAALGTEAPPVEAAPTPPAPVEQALPEAPPVEAAPAPPAPVEQALPEAPPVEAAPAPIEHVAPAGPPPKSVEEFLQDLASADTGVKIEALRWLPSFDDIQVPGMVEMAMFDPDP